jgi:hypothetical protein
MPIFSKLWNNYPLEEHEKLFTDVLGGGWPALVGNASYENTCKVRDHRSSPWSSRAKLMVPMPASELPAAWLKEPPVIAYTALAHSIEAAAPRLAYSRLQCRFHGPGAIREAITIAHPAKRPSPDFTGFQLPINPTTSQKDDFRAKLESLESLVIHC